MPTLALFGAAGATGKSIAHALSARGLPYRVVGRDHARLAAAFGHDPLAELVTWNPDDPASVRAAATGVDTLLYLVGAPYHQNALHPRTTRQTLDGALAAGVRRMVLLGTVYPYGLPQTTPVTEAHPRHPHTFKGRMRKQQEDLLFDAHAQGRLQTSILRLPDFYGPGVGEVSFLHLAFKAAAEGGRAFMIGPVDTPHEFLYVPDLGPIAVDLALHPGAYGHAFNLAGAGTLTQREAAHQIFALAGRQPKLFPLGKTALRAAGLFNPVLREFVEMNYLQTTPLLLDDSALARLLVPLRKTSYAEGLRQTFLSYQKAAATPHSRAATPTSLPA